MAIVIQILGVLLLLGIGALARRRNWLTGAGTSELAKVLVQLVYPALVLQSMGRKSLGDLAQNWPLPLLTTALALGGLLMGWLIIRWVGHMPEATTRAFLFHCLINNYLFLPLPLVKLLCGDDGVSLLVFSSVGYEVVLWTVGVFLFAPGTGLRQRLRMTMAPPVVALGISLLYIVARDTGLVQLPAASAAGTVAEIFRMLRFALNTIAGATIPMAFLVAGSRMAVLRFHTVMDRRVWLVALLRLVVIPVMMISVFRLLPLAPLARQVLVIVTVMPSAVVSVIFSERFGGDSEFIAGVLLLTHLAALVTIPLLLIWALPT